jgi:hypothetical protein
MKKMTFLGGLFLLFAALGNTSFAQCTIDLTAQTTNGAAFDQDRDGKVESMIYFRESGTDIIPVIVNSETSDVTNLAAINYDFSTIEEIVSGNFSQLDGASTIHAEVILIARTPTNDTRIDLLTHTGATMQLFTMGTYTGLDPDDITGRLVSAKTQSDAFYDKLFAFRDLGGGSTSLVQWNFNGATTFTTVWLSTSYTASQITNRVVSGDFDRDGRQDDLAAFYDYGGGQTRIHVWKGGFGSYTAHEVWTSTSYTANQINNRVVAGDFDRDGKWDDIAAFYDYGGGQTRIHVWESTGSSINFSAFTYWTGMSYTAGQVTGKVVAVNNGSKKSDILALYNYGASTTSYHHFEAQNPWPGSLPEYFTVSNVGFCTLAPEAFDEKQEAVESPSDFVTNNGLGAPPTKVYPNPVQNELNIQFSNLFTSGVVNVQLLDMSGRLILSDQFAGNETATVQLDISSIPQGMYMVRLTNEQEEQEVLKITKK